ncbi:MAG: L-fuconate dehydratase [Pseudonocardiales bacterium]|nr:mandelate racemase/muconate lactonizing enzyme [Pseudonocardiales bacterium]MDT4908561.1 L-fuconate dehydratase [Pseudonocardiales bacterium]MDT4957197.1 L-fuconate dehydratase [Pseudonocardiales bacterium]MDT4970995.1 L-fuconate dehydratase [Pseudonocardiales bacterium]
MSIRIASFELVDLRFPTSADLSGSDAMNADPDYSAAYVVIRSGDGAEGHGFVFTIGRGNDVVLSAIHALEHLVLGLDLDETFADMGAFYRRLVHDSHLRWLGPEKGVMHMAIGAVVNAVWDLYAKREGKPLWKVLADFTPEQIVDLIDFRYLSDALTRDDALAILTAAVDGKQEREQQLLDKGYPGYTTSAGWLGYSDEKVARLVGEAIADGFTHLKIKVGADPADDVHRVRMVRELAGPDVLISVDANQRWDVAEAIENVRRLADADLYWVEEPTSPDDVIGHRAIAEAIHPIRVATGEHVANRVVFKQLMATGAIDICQIDACRVAGVNENIAILLLAAKFGVPVCPHAGGVGLCEVVQHLSMFDFLAISGSTEGRWIEYVDHLHEHFADPVHIRGGHYMPPRKPGSGAEIVPSTRAAYRFPDGPIWTEPR